MKTTYDVTLPERKATGGKKSEETLAIISFLAGQHRNMCFEYDTEKACKARYGTLRSYRRTNKLQNVFDLYRVDKCIYIIRTKKGGSKS